MHNFAAAIAGEQKSKKSQLFIQQFSTNEIRFVCVAHFRSFYFIFLFSFNCSVENLRVKQYEK